MHVEGVVSDASSVLALVVLVLLGACVKFAAMTKNLANRLICVQQ